MVTDIDHRSVTGRTRPALWIDAPGTNGRRRVRLGWSSREAGLLAAEDPIPARTVEHWAATRFVTPTVRPALAVRGYPNPTAVIYGLGDIVALRMARDLLARHIDRDTVRDAARTLAAWDPRHWRDWRRIAAEHHVVYVLPAGPLVREADLGPHPEGHDLLYPASTVAADIVERIGRWRHHQHHGHTRPLAAWC